MALAELVEGDVMAPLDPSASEAEHQTSSLSFCLRLMCLLGLNLGRESLKKVPEEYLSFC